MKLDSAKLFFIEKMQLHINEVLEIKQVLNGHSNYVYFVTYKSKNYYLRITKLNTLINRDDEKNVLDRLGIKYYYYNQKGDMIRDWFEAEHNLTWNNQKITSISHFMDKLHRLPTEDISVFNHKQYEPYIINSEYAEYYYLYLKLVDKYSYLNICVCHNDLNATNILYDSLNIIVIDYERVRLNTVYFDFANLAREDMSMEQIKFLCEYNKLEFDIFLDHIIITCIYALQWTLFANDNTILGEYQKSVLTRLKLFMQIRNIKLDC